MFAVTAGDETWRTARVELDAAQSENRSPDARNDSVTLVEGGATIVDLLANDADPDGDALTITQVEAPDGLRAQIRGDAVRVIAEDGFSGEALVTYTVRDERGGTDTAEISALVEAAPSDFEGELSIASQRNDPSPQRFESGAQIDAEAFSADGALTFALLVAEKAPEVGSVSIDYRGRTHIDNTEAFSFSTGVVNYFGPDGIAEGEHKIGVTIHSEQDGAGEIVDAFTFEFEVV
ncbi:MAG: Ig-like domain-containing protein [Pseudomonadota bacterium]